MHFKHTTKELLLRRLNYASSTKLLGQLHALSTIKQDDPRYQAVLDAIPLGISVVNAFDAKFSYTNRRAIEINGYNCVGYDLAAHFKKVKFLTLQGEPLPFEDMLTNRLLRLGKPVLDQKIALKRDDGIRIPVCISSVPLRNAQGKITDAIIIFDDITERTRLEREILERTKELLRSEHHYRTLLENIPVIINQYDKELRYLYRSPMWGNFYCNNLESAIGKAWAELGIPEEVYKPWGDKITEALTTGQPVEYETPYPNEDGEIRDYLARVIPIFDKTGQIESILSVSIDITERKRTEAELARLECLNIVGEMAAALGHEVRNPLTTVRGYLQMFQRKSEITKYHEQFQTMIEELDRANVIITNFLSLAKNRHIELTSTNLNDVILTLVPLLQAEAIQRGHVLTSVLGEVPEFNMNEGEIRQLVLNLTRNAFDAMEPGGQAQISTNFANNNVVLTISDTGKGIPTEVLKKLGTPFTTTKENGTGLGISICYRIAERHGAKISVDTSPNGTTFTIQFPT